MEESLKILTSWRRKRLGYERRRSAPPRQRFEVQRKRNFEPSCRSNVRTRKCHQSNFNWKSRLPQSTLSLASVSPFSSSPSSLNSFPRTLPSRRKNRDPASPPSSTSISSGVWLAIFFYVGSEVTIGSILVNYLGDPTVANLPEERSRQVSLLLLGRIDDWSFHGRHFSGEMKESNASFPTWFSPPLFPLSSFTPPQPSNSISPWASTSILSIFPFIGLIALSFIFFKLGKLQCRPHGGILCSRSRQD